MSASGQEGHETKYTTPLRVQAWFLQRSRNNWKKKYMELKGDAKRLQNRVNDVSKSREQWRDETKQLLQRVEELEAANTALREQLASLKKDGPASATGSAR
jgi:chromosome segregation ATPase